MKKLISYKNLNRDIFLSIITFFIWASVGSKYNHLTDFNIKVILNNIRFFIPLIIVVLFFFLKKNQQNSFSLTNIIFFIFLSYLIGNYNLYFNNNFFVQKFNNEEYLLKTGYLPNLMRDIMMGVYFICSYLIFSRLDEKETTKLLKINYIFLILISFITLYFAYIDYLGNDKHFLYFTQFLKTGKLLGVPTIRSLGLSRNLFIIFIPLAIIYILDDKKNFNFLIILLLIFLATNIFQLQSRLTTYSFYIFFVLNFLIFIYKKKFNKIISITLIFLIIPNLLNILIPNLKMLKHQTTIENKIVHELSFKDFFSKIIIPQSRINTFTPNNPDVREKYNNDEFILLSEYSSGRLVLWKKILDIYKNKESYNLKNRSLGFGNSADRFFIKESASNALLYILISGGFIGLFFLIFFYLYILKLIYFFLKNKEKYSKNVMVCSLIGITLFIMLRSLVENSFLLYGTDNIVLFMCLIYLNNKKIN